MIKPKCSRCIHKDVCSDTLIKLTLFEYGECNHFIDESSVILKDVKIDKCQNCISTLCREISDYENVCKKSNFNLYMPPPELDDTKYIKYCPVCGHKCFGSIGHNLFCNCGAKYYPDNKMWLDRKSGKEIPEIS